MADYLSTDPTAGLSNPLPPLSSLAGGSGIGNRIAQILIQKGTITAQDLQQIAQAQAAAQRATAQILSGAQQQSGQTWAQTLHQLGQLPMQVLQQIKALQTPTLTPTTTYSPTNWQMSLPGLGTTLQGLQPTATYDPTTWNVPLPGGSGGL